MQRAVQIIQHAAKRDFVPNPIDIHVGGRIRLRRNLVGISQGHLGKALGLTFQQVQKYERGANRIGASRLYHIARLLNVSVGWFFDDLPAPQLNHVDSRNHKRNLCDQTCTSNLEFHTLHQHETLSLLRAYYNISDPIRRSRILELAESMAFEDAPDK